MFYRYCRYLLNILSKILFQFHVNNRNNFNKVKGAILAVNHASYADPAFAGIAAPRPIYFLTRKSLFKNKFATWLLTHVNAIPFNRDAPDTKSIRTVVNMLQNGKIVLIFPEGTRSPDGKLQAAHLGVGFIAAHAKVPVIPAYISGSYKIWPRHKKYFSIAKAKINIGEPLHLDKWLNKPGLDKSDYQEITNHIMQKIKELA